MLDKIERKKEETNQENFMGMSNCRQKNKLAQKNLQEKNEEKLFIR